MWNGKFVYHVRVPKRGSYYKVSITPVLKLVFFRDQSLWSKKDEINTSFQSSQLHSRDFDPPRINIPGWKSKLIPRIVEFSIPGHATDGRDIECRRSLIIYPAGTERVRFTSFPTIPFAFLALPRIPRKSASHFGKPLWLSQWLEPTTLSRKKSHRHTSWRPREHR